MPARVPPLLDLIRLFVGVSLLGFASYTDWMWRRAANLLWRVMSLAGLLLLGVEAWLDPAPWATTTADEACMHRVESFEAGTTSALDGNKDAYWQERDFLAELRAFLRA